MTDHIVQQEDSAERLYFDLLKQVLTRTDLEETYRPLHSKATRIRRIINPAILRALGTFDLELRRRIPPSVRREGHDWPSDAETMIGMLRLDNLEECIIDVLEAGIPGDLIETGVWRGGATIFMRAILKARGVTDRNVWVADSFQGLPKPDVMYPADDDDPHWENDLLAVGIEEVKANFRKYRLLDQQVRFLPGWFKDTLPSAPIDSLALLRLDGDMYESTIVSLEALYPRLSPGGYAIIDDYQAVSGCHQAVTDFRTKYGIEDTMHMIDWAATFWQKSR
jgi:O-methyltransferase